MWWHLGTDMGRFPAIARADVKARQTERAYTWGGLVKGTPMSEIASDNGRRAFLATGLAACALGPTGAAARNARVISVSTRRSLPVMRPDTPTPADRGQIFYFQLSSTRNTVVYAARFGSDGRLDARNPVVIYWRNYQGAGDTRSLNFPERALAYGLNISAGAAAGDFEISFRAVAGFPLVLRQIAPFEAAFIGRHQGLEMRLIYGYLTVIDGLIPRVPELRMFGQLPDGQYGEAVIEPRG
jgi:hypothetical protein